MTDRIDDGLRWLAESGSASPDEFRAAHRDGSDMLLTALRGSGYVREGVGEARGRYAVSDAGFRRLRASEADGWVP